MLYYRFWKHSVECVFKTCICFWICRTFDDFLKGGLVEFLDVNEEDDGLFAMYEKDITM